jgi:hypothetical protein
MATRPKRIIRTGDKTEPPPVTQEQADQILLEIGRLYRERIRALYNNDQSTLQSIALQIEALKSKFPKI